jgi:hypothetical protein
MHRIGVRMGRGTRGLWRGRAVVRGQRRGLRYQGGGPAGQDRVAAGDQRSHEASSTSQRHSAPKEIPQAAACSGVSEVGVMPGWVLVSSKISPDRPRPRPNGNRCG